MQTGSRDVEQRDERDGRYTDRRQMQRKANCGVGVGIYFNPYIYILDSANRMLA
jgi:hypothetical protein